MRLVAIRDVNFNLGGDDDGSRDGGGGDGGDGGSFIRHACSRATIRDLDHISSLRLRENPPTDYYSGVTRSLEVKCRSKFSRSTG